MSFEESATRIEEIIGIIEEGDTPLDTALELYAEGAALTAASAKRLTAARERVTVLSREIGGIVEKRYNADNNVEEAE